ATGWNTYILRQVLRTKTTKKFLFATICDPAAYQIVSQCKVGEEISIRLGVGFDALSQAVELDAVVKSSG
ncbi:MlrC C-terminal domain-containing protein, partial [Desulfovibrio desulfuricans]|nr:MlrC C-terminal domain-containing protein [Desulfovibrio desulfuricans]